MFVRIDKDLSVNINNIFSYKLSEDEDSYKLQIWSLNGGIAHTVIYMKGRADQMKILIEFNNVMRELTTNLDIPVMEEPKEVKKDKKHIKEQLSFNFDDPVIEEIID